MAIVRAPNHSAASGDRSLARSAIATGYNAAPPAPEARMPRRSRSAAQLAVLALGFLGCASDVPASAPPAATAPQDPTLDPARSSLEEARRLEQAGEYAKS